MARLISILSIKTRLKALRATLLKYRLYLLAVLFSLFVIPFFFLFSHFKAHYSRTNNFLTTLKKIRLSQESLSSARKKHPLTLKSQLLSIAPLQSQKEALFSIKEYLPQKECSQIEDFFAKNQLHLQKINVESKNGQQLHHLKLIAPVLINAHQGCELISLIESQEALAFSSFTLEKKKPNDNLLTLDFTLTVYNNHG